MLGLIAYLVILCAIAVGTLFRPAVGLAGIVCLFGLKQWGQTTTTIFAEYKEFTNVAIGVLVVLAVVRVLFKRSCLLCQWPPVATLVALLLFYALSTTAWAVDSDAALEQWVKAAPYLLTMVLLAPLLLSDLRDVRTGLLWTLCIGGTLCFLDLVFGKWGLRGLVLGPSEYSIETNPLALAGLAGSVMLVASMFILEKTMLTKIIAIVCIPIALGVILKSGSRGQFIAVVPGFAVAASIAFRLKSARSVAALFTTTAIVLALGWWAATVIQFNSDRFSATAQASEDILSRFDMANTLLGASLSRPYSTLFGLGNSSSWEILGIYPHITILEVIAEEGVPGIVLYLAILTITVRSILRISRSLGESRTDRRTLAMLAALFVFELILSWKQGSLLYSNYVFAYAIILGRIELSAVKRVVAGRPTVEQTALPFPHLLR